MNYLLLKGVQLCSISTIAQIMIPSTTFGRGNSATTVNNPQDRHPQHLVPPPSGRKTRSAGACDTQHKISQESQPSVRTPLIYCV
mmetsp:Transcript_10410/g.15771  ORF Transcript_10410/g.15771 Transcript_10410/m.15771 type:complete len:85 (-) Transcript_10410:7485-7739(-)